MTRRYSLVLNSGQMQQLQDGDQTYGGMNYGRRNAIMNGGFDLWQRGTSFVSPAAGVYNADRWAWDANTTGAVTIARGTDVPTVSQSGTLSQYSMQVSCTASQSSPSSTQYAALKQSIEGFHFNPLAQRSTSLSFWAKYTKTGVYSIALRNSGADRSWISNYTVPDTNWNKYSINPAASPSAGTWNYANGVGITLWFPFMCGATFQGTAATWNSANNIASSSQVNGLDSNTNVFKITQVQFEPGDIVTQYEAISPIDELLRCQRYYFKTFPLTTAPVQAVGSVVGALWMVGNTLICGDALQLPTRMRVAPTVTTYNPISANANWRDTGANVDRTLIMGTIGENMIGVAMTASAAGNANQIHITADAEL